MNTIEKVYASRPQDYDNYPRPVYLLTYPNNYWQWQRVMTLLFGIVQSTAGITQSTPHKFTQN